MTQILNLNTLTAPGQKVNLLGPGMAATITNLSSAQPVALVANDVTTGAISFSLASGATRTLYGPVAATTTGKARLLIEEAPLAAGRSPNAETRFWGGGISPLKAATAKGTDTSVTANTAYVVSVNLPRTTLTGAAFLIGTTGGTHKACVILYDRYGGPLAWHTPAGTTVGTANTYQSLDFVAPVDILSPGRHFLGVAYSGTTPTLQLEDVTVGTAGDTAVIGGTAASAVDFAAAPVKITTPSTVSSFPIMFTY